MKQARDAWFTHFADVRVDQLVFVDEFGAATNMQRTHGRAPPGERVVCKVPHGHWKVLSTIAAMTRRGIIASATFEGATDTEMFVTFVREGLAPLLRRGQVVVMDNLSVHRNAEARRLIERRGAELIFLPPYSPDYNPIELAISKIKGVLRTLARRNVDDLCDAIGQAMSSITLSDATHFIGYRGYPIR